MSTRTKYEDAGGVVPLAWRRGAPSDAARASIIVETWRINPTVLNYNGSARADVTATLTAHEWDWSASAWVPALDAKNVRRWAGLESRFTRLSITLDAWRKS